LEKEKNLCRRAGLICANTLSDGLKNPVK